MKIIEQKIIIVEIKDLPNELNTRVEMTEDRIGKMHKIPIECTQSKQGESSLKEKLLESQESVDQ